MNCAPFNALYENFHKHVNIGPKGENKQKTIEISQKSLLMNQIVLTIKINGQTTHEHLPNSQEILRIAIGMVVIDDNELLVDIPELLNRIY
jgi:hypothetical protein